MPTNGKELKSLIIQRVLENIVRQPPKKMRTVEVHQGEKSQSSFGCKCRVRQMDREATVLQGGECRTRVTDRASRSVGDSEGRRCVQDGGSAPGPWENQTTLQCTVCHSLTLCLWESLLTFLTFEVVK